MLTDTQVVRKDVGESVSEDQKKYLRSFGLPVGSIKSVSLNIHNIFSQSPFKYIKILPLLLADSNSCLSSSIKQV